MNYKKFYADLFSGIVNEYGELDPETLTAIIGFSGGGPVSLNKISRKNLFVTCELALYPEQKRSTEQLRYEFMATDFSDVGWCQSVFTALGNLSFNAVLGDKHTIDITGVSESGPRLIRLSLFSRCSIDGGQYGIYKVSPA
ncbi:hypothetical protein [Pseudomonas flexibilis]|uniref:hypothetical protein n=1 Tax=Pseudomonas flexibilis TaxID=706570 RepID=UPI000B192C18|nr:hypothetical protein [Pseudomonas flexibilis]